MPFSVEQFFDVFRRYNEAIYPLQFVLNALAIVATAAIAGNFSGRIVSAVLGILWLWTGIAYHLFFFSTVNPAAYLFGFFFLIQGMLFLYVGVVRRAVAFRRTINAECIIGAIFILFALVVYPLIGYASGHIYPASPTFGAPCPVTIFTFGVLLFTDRRLPIYFYAIPFLWSLIGTSAALQLGVHEDLGMTAAGLITLGLLRYR